MFHHKQTNFGEAPTAIKDKKKNTQAREFLAKLSRAFMLPVAMLPIAGLALGIGTTINSQASSQIVQTLGYIIMVPGNIIFAILPILFAIAIAITFTNDSGTAGLSALVGYAVFVIFQSALVISPQGTDPNYHYLWYTFDELKFSALFTDIIGIQTLSSSIFGGVIVGATVAYLYSKFKNIQLPKMIGFFGGVRFIPIVTFGAMCVIGMLFAMIWPVLGLGFYYLGEGLALGGKYGGITSLAYGIFNRALVPFGLHHILNMMLWFSSVGGQINTGSLIFNGHSWAELAGATPAIITGDINIQIFLTRIIGHNNVYGGDITIQNLIDAYNGQATDGSVLAPGQYTNFAYIFGMFGLPGAALGMLFAAPKGDNRKLAASIVIPGAIVSSLTGTSEAIEFTFLFLAPWLFWGFHAFMAGLGGMITTIFCYYAKDIAPHVTFSFSQGIIDFIIYGVVPDVRGGGTHCWMLLIMSIAYLPIYWGVFYWAIKKWNLKTPGRDGATKLFTKADWIKKQEDEKKPKHIQMYDKSMEVIKAYGGPENIKNVDACITKLRIQVKDKKVVDGERLKHLGALGITHPSPESVYAVFGTDADIIKNNIKEIISKGLYTKKELEVEIKKELKKEISEATKESKEG